MAIADNVAFRLCDEFIIFVYGRACSLPGK